MFTKFSTSAKRALIMCAAVMAIVMGVSGTAQAASARIILSDIDGRQLGYADYLDATNGTLRVCDTQNDGYGVSARITQGNNIIATVYDDSDAGCGSKTVTLDNGEYYLLKIWWHGPGAIDYSRGFQA